MNNEMNQWTMNNEQWTRQWTMNNEQWIMIHD